jgi:CRISPR/Cas system-associated exonuclease Cas4 (RecB family)
MSINDVTSKINFKRGNSVFLPIYERHLIKKGEASRDNRGYSYFHPSAFGDCVRKMAIQYYSELEPSFKPEIQIDPKFMRICDAGHAFHHRMQEDLAVMGVLRGYWRCRSCDKVFGKENPIGIFLPEKCDCQKEEDKRRGIKLFEYEEIRLESEEKYNFKGNTDGVIEIERDVQESRYIIDFKSIKDKRFSFLKEPDHKYIVQVMIYMWLTGVKKAIIYYEDKSEHSIKEFVVNYDEKMVENIKLTALKLNKILKLGKIPKRPEGYDYDCFHCKYCDYRSVCYRDKE